MLNRRDFVAALLSTAGAISLCRPHALRAAPAEFKLAGNQRRALLAALEREDPDYDPAARMLRAPPDGARYHTQIKTGIVHPTRASLTYAAALFDSGIEERVRRAKQILPVVIDLQDQDPASTTYGLWPWFLEEPLDKMLPADWDWADHCGVQLLTVWLGHVRELDEELTGMVRASSLHAARSIERRDIAPRHTHIALMGTYVTLVAAQEFKLADLRGYARERLRKLHRFIFEEGSLREYNSPTDTIIALAELSRMLQHVKDARDRQLISAMHELAWKHAATHFHPPTRQWAGPHSRCSETDLRKLRHTLAFIEAATGGRARFELGDPLPLDLDASRLPLDCPRKFIRHYAELPGPRELVETFARAEPQKPGGKNPVTGTTYLHPRFTLGSVNRGDFWQQRRPLLAYWGSVERCATLRVRFLHDDDDFASALIFSAQHQGQVLSMVVFATDHGDTHPSLDKLEDGTISARDLRLRFEFGSDFRDFALRSWPGPEKAMVFQDRNARFILRPLGGRFGEEDVDWKFPETQVAGPFDVVLYSGAEKTIPLNTLSEAWLGFTLEEWPYDQKVLPSGPARLTRGPNRVQARWSVQRHTLEVGVAIKPASFDSLNDSFSGAVSRQTKAVI